MFSSCKRNFISPGIMESADDFWIAWFQEAGIWVRNVVGSRIIADRQSICGWIIHTAHLWSDSSDSIWASASSSARLGRHTRGPAALLSCRSTAGPLVMHRSARVAQENTVSMRPWSRLRRRAVQISGHVDSEQFERLHPLHDCPSDS